MNYEKLASEILALIGGAENVVGLTHCATRLRFNLKDFSLAQTKKIEKLTGVLGIAESGGQYQIIIGNDVNNVYKPLIGLCNLQEETKIKEDDNKSVGAKIIDTITGIFTPILPAITAAGMIKAVLALLIAFKLIDTTSSTYMVINFMADAAFYFLPFLLAASAAKKFGCNQYLAMMLAGMFLHPTFVQMVSQAKETGQAIEVFGLPMYNATYSSSVIPIILTVWVMSYIEPFADKYSIKAIKFFMKPLIIAVVAGFLGLYVFGPIGYIVASWIAFVINALNTHVGWLVPMILGGLFPIFVMSGTHYGLIPIGINNRLTTGFDYVIYPANLASNIAQGAATFGVALKTKKEDLKQLATSAGITAVCGITEPALYGVNMKNRSALIAAVIGGASGGLFMGILSVRNYAGGSPGLLTLPGYIGDRGFYDIMYAAIGALIAFVISFAISYITYKDPVEEEIENDCIVDEKIIELNKGETETIKAPVSGKTIALKDVNDPTFSQEIMGKGIAIIPSESIFYSPIKGKVQMIFETKHAIGLVSDNGMEVLIHVGIDTVNLKGEPFKVLVKEGQFVDYDTPILEVDLNKIKEKGFDITTPIIITNSINYGDILPIVNESVESKDSIVKVIK